MIGRPQRELLDEQPAALLPSLAAISEAQSLGRYAPDKWSMREVLGHINDGERLFAFRAFWFARGLETPLPSFDQDVAAGASGAGEISWLHHVKEFAAARAATSAFFSQPSRRGMDAQRHCQRPSVHRASAGLCNGWARGASLEDF